MGNVHFKIETQDIASLTQTKPLRVDMIMQSQSQDILGRCIQSPLIGPSLAKLPSDWIKSFHVANVSASEISLADCKVEL